MSAFLDGGDLLVAAGLMLVFEVDEFRHVIGLDGKYERMDHLKTKVIKPALRDVNAHTDLAVTFGERRRRGAAVPYLEGPDWQARRFYIEENARVGEDWTQAKERLTKELRRGIIREDGEIIQ